MSELKQETHSEIHEQLLQAMAWFKSIGISVTGSRLELISKNVELIKDHWDKPSMNDVEKEHPPQELWQSLLDARSFIIIFKQLSKLKSHKLARQQLTKIVSGPLMPGDEGLDGDTIQARNILFELELGAR